MLLSRIGTLIAPIIKKHIESTQDPSRPASQVLLKWPNDVLIDSKKVSDRILIHPFLLSYAPLQVCGTLIEMDGDRLFIGIGCNVYTAPAVAQTGREGGRPATCLAAHWSKAQQAQTNYEEKEVGRMVDEDGTVQVSGADGAILTYDTVCASLARTVTDTIRTWCDSQRHTGSADRATAIITEYENWMDRSPQALRR